MSKDNRYSLTPARDEAVEDKNAQSKTSSKKIEAKIIDFSFIKNQIIQGLVYAEILGKPKCKKGRRRGR